MKNRMSFLALGFVGIFALLPGCGEDEGTGDEASGGSGGNEGCRLDEDCSENRLCIGLRGNGDDYCDEGETCICVGGGEGGTGGTTGGSSGKGGSSGATLGGSGGKGGTGGSGVIPTTTLGEPCASDADCEGLTCLLPDGLPSGDGPPNGLCSQTCASDDECLELASAAYCVIFEGDPMVDPIRYCIPACTGGVAGAPKCGTRDDFACNILDTVATTQACIGISDCGLNQVCFEDVCQDMVTACTPVCRADSDCAEEQFCNFSSGFCTATEPTGLPIGSLCDPSLPAAQDECNGFCSPTDATEAQGTCAAFCSASIDGYGCGWVGDGAADAACLYPTVISRDAAGNISLAESDLMICGQLCDCNDDCPADIEYCMDENAGDADFSIQTLFGRPGYCRPLQTGETEADDSIGCAQASK